MSDDPLNLLVQVNRSRSAAAGLDVYLYDHLAAEVTSFDGWRTRFEVAANQFSARAAEALERDFKATAGEAYATASLLFHYATCVPGGDREAIGALLQQAAQAHRAALAATGRPFVLLGDADTGSLFCGILELPAGGVAAPVVIIVPGLDSSKEEFDLIATSLRARGLATLRIDGPGQGEMLRHSRPLPDYERVVAAAIDNMAGQPGINLARIGCIGLSLGGYYVPRAIAHDMRVRAAAAVTGPYRFAAWTELADILREILTLRCGGSHQAEAFVATVDLTPFAGGIEQPLLVIAGEIDPVVPLIDPRRLAQEAPHAKLLELSGGDHLGASRRWEWEAYMADWLAEHLATSLSDQKGD